MSRSASTAIPAPILISLVLLLEASAASGQKENVQETPDFIAFQSTRTQRWAKILGPFSDGPGNRVYGRDAFMGDVYILDTHNGSVSRLSRDEVIREGFRRGRVAWSPDRKWLAWPGEYALFVSDTSGDTKLVCQHDRGSFYPSGRRLAYQHPRCRYGPHLAPLPPWGFAWAADSKRLAIWKSGDGKTVICRLDGSIEREFEAIADGTLADLDWSRDGLLAQAVHFGDGTFKLYTLNPESDKAERKAILDFEGPLYGISFSPDGKKLLFVGMLETDWFIYTVELDGGGLKELATGVDGDGQAGLAPALEDDGRIDDDEFREFLARQGYSHEYSSYVAGKYEANRPRWSPDGRRVLYVDGGHIYVVNRDGTGLKDLTPSEMMADEPVWSPDGRRIAFQRLIWIRHPDGRLRARPFRLIWIMDEDGSNPLQLTECEDLYRMADMYPEWAPY